VVQREKHPSGSDLNVRARCDVLMAAGFRIPIPIVIRSPIDWQSLNSVLSRPHSGPHQSRLRAFVLAQQPPLVQESGDMSVENLSLRSIWARPVLLKVELS
jgi:hypothetical protein